MADSKMDKVHHCNFKHAALDSEVMFALQRSAAEGGQVALTMTAPADEQTMLTARAPDRPVFISCKQNCK